MLKKSKLNSLIIYFVLAYIISWALWSSSVVNTQVKKVPDILLLFSQFALLGPAIAAFILRAKEDGKAGINQLFRSSWNWNFKPIWLLPTLLLPAAMILATLAIKLPIEQKAFELFKTPLPLPIFAVLLFFIGGPLEEFGWRGYALPRLMKRYSFLPAALVLGALHGLWHLPLHFMEGTVQAAIPIGEFIAVTTIGSVIYAWIYKNTNGNLTLMFLHHWAGNLAAAVMVYWDTALGRWVFFGVQLVVVVVIVISELSKKHIDKKV